MTSMARLVAGYLADFRVVAKPRVLIRTSELGLTCSQFKGFPSKGVSKNYG